MENISDKNNGVKVQQLDNRIAQSIALLEEATVKIEEETALASERMEASDEYFEKRMSKIEDVISELREFMTQTGAARLRISAEHALQEGKQHLAEIRHATEDFQRISEESCRRLNQVSKTASDTISQSVESLKLDEFKKFSTESAKQVRETSRVAIQRLRRMVQWFRWERLGMAVAVAVVVAMLTGLFINDEAPWESHKKVVAEREAGQMLLRVWPKLSNSEKTQIESAANYL